MYKILIVDDKEIFRRKIKRLSYFKDSDDFQIAAEAENGLKALDILEKEEIDVVITDIRMPIVNGIELLKNINNKKLCSCVILLSEYSDFEYAKEGLINGAFDYIVKPIDNDKFSGVLERAKTYLNKVNDSKYYTIHEINMICECILNGDEYCLEIIDKIYAVVIAQKISFLEVDVMFSNILMQIQKKLVKKNSYLDKFIDFSEICVIEDKENIREEIQKKIKDIMDEINNLNIYTKNKLVNSAVLYVLENIEEEFSLGSIAEKYFVNKNYLSHLFKIETNKNFLEFVMCVKMRYAKNIIKKDDMKVYEIANLLGYKDSEYFSRVFKDYYKCSPSKFRKQAINENS